MSRNCPSASDIAPDLVKAVSFLNPVQMRPNSDEYETAAFQIAAIVEAVFQEPQTLPRVLGNLKQFGEVEDRPQAGNLAGQLHHAQDLLECSAAFHREQADWFEDQSKKFSRLTFRSAPETPADKMESAFFNSCLILAWYRKRYGELPDNASSLIFFALNFGRGPDTEQGRLQKSARELKDWFLGNGPHPPAEDPD